MILRSEAMLSRRNKNEIFSGTLHCYFLSVNSYRIQPNYHTYSYKRIVKQFRLQQVYFLSTCL